MCYCSKLQYMYACVCTKITEAEWEQVWRSCSVKSSFGVKDYQALYSLSRHVRNKWCNEQSHPVLYFHDYQLVHAHRDPAQKLTNLFYERWKVIQTQMFRQEEEKAV